MKLLQAVKGTDSADQANHIAGPNGLKNLTAELATKVIDPELPFPITQTAITEDGVYFIGNAERKRQREQQERWRCE